MINNDLKYLFIARLFAKKAVARIEKKNKSQRVDLCFQPDFHTNDAPLSQLKGTLWTAASSMGFGDALCN